MIIRTIRSSTLALLIVGCGQGATEPAPFDLDGLWRQTSRECTDGSPACWFVDFEIGDPDCATMALQQAGEEEGLPATIQVQARSAAVEFSVRRHAPELFRTFGVDFSGEASGNLISGRSRGWSLRTGPGGDTVIAWSDEPVSYQRESTVSGLLCGE